MAAEGTTLPTMTTPPTMVLLAGGFGVSLLSDLSPPQLTEDGGNQTPFKDPAEVYHHPPDDHPVTTTAWSPIGDAFAFVTSLTHVHLVRLTSGTKPQVQWERMLRVIDENDTVQCAHVFVSAVTFSPNGKYVLVHCSFTAALHSRQPASKYGNIFVFSASDASLLYRTALNGTSSRINWAGDSTHLLILRDAELQLISTESWDVVYTIQRLSGAESIACSPASLTTCYVAVSSPSKLSNGRRSGFGILRLYDISIVVKYKNDTPLASRQLSSIDDFKCYWSPRATTLVVAAISEDASSTYYAHSFVFCLGGLAAASEQQNKAYSNLSFYTPITMNELVLPEKNADDSLLDFTWGGQAAKRESGVAVYGKLPAHAVLLDHVGQVRFNFGQGNANEAHFSPNARLVLLGAYGGLRGQSCIWDVNKQKKVGDFTAADTVVHEWLPDSRGLVIATTCPRMRVDNALELWSVDGERYFRREYNDLYVVAVRPASEPYPDRAISPPRLKRGLDSVSRAEEKRSSARPMVLHAGARTRAFGGTNSSFGAARQVEQQSPIIPSQSTVVGDVPLSAAAKRRARKKMREQS